MFVSLGSCGANEVFYEQMYSGHHASGNDSCKMFINYLNYQPLKWGPHCECKIGFARILNGKCVPNNSTQCANLYKPSKGSFII